MPIESQWPVGGLRGLQGVCECEEDSCLRSRLHITASQSADEVPFHFQVGESANGRGFQMALPMKKQCVLVRKTANCLGIVRSCDELASRLERAAKGQHKIP